MYQLSKRTAKNVKEHIRTETAALQAGSPVQDSNSSIQGLVNRSTTWRQDCLARLLIDENTAATHLRWFQCILVAAVRILIWCVLLVPIRTKAIVSISVLPSGAECLWCIL